MIRDKADAHAFLDDLGQSIAEGAPKGTAMEREVRRTMTAAREDAAQKHLKTPEAAFLNRFVVPVLFEQIRHHSKLTIPQAREALLNEYHHCMPDFSLRSPSRHEKHAFKKVVGASPESIYRAWTDSAGGLGLTRSCPDFAVTDPFPHRIVFEGKYFARGSKKYAESELVKDLYQAFFYRGLPYLDATKRHPEWNYDYACLLAFDSSPNGSLKTAWNGLDRAVRKSFWESANIYVMILGGEGEVS